MENGFGDDDALRQARSRRRFQTGLLIFLLLFFMDARGPQETQAKNRATQARRNEEDLKKTGKTVDRLLDRLAEDAQHSPQGPFYHLRDQSSLKGEWHRAEGEQFRTVVPVMKERAGTKQRQDLRNETIASSKPGTVPFKYSQMSAMLVPSKGNDVSTVVGRLRLGQSVTQSGNDAVFEGLFFHKYGHMSAVVGALGEDLKLVWNKAAWGGGGEASSPLSGAPAPDDSVGRLAMGSDGDGNGNGTATATPGNGDRGSSVTVVTTSTADEDGAEEEAAEEEAGEGEGEEEGGGASGGEAGKGEGEGGNDRRGRMLKSLVGDGEVAAAGGIGAQSGLRRLERRTTTGLTEQGEALGSAGGGGAGGRGAAVEQSGARTPGFRSLETNLQQHGHETPAAAPRVEPAAAAAAASHVTASSLRPPRPRRLDAGSDEAAGPRDSESPEAEAKSEAVASAAAAAAGDTDVVELEASMTGETKDDNNPAPAPAASPQAERGGGDVEAATGAESWAEAGTAVLMREFPAWVMPKAAVLEAGQESGPLPSQLSSLKTEYTKGCQFLLTLQTVEDEEDVDAHAEDEPKADLMRGEMVGINCNFSVVVEFQMSDSLVRTAQSQPMSYSVALTMVCLLQMCLLCCRVGLMLAQRRYGRNFMVPRRFQPPKFDYHRPIPPELAQQAQTAGGQHSEETRDIEAGNLLDKGHVMPMAMLGRDRRRPQVPSKLRVAEQDAATKPPEVKSTLVRNAFAAISSSFPVMRDTLWVEDVMWALRVRKTRRDFDKWEVNEHRDEWVCILEAATPDHPTVFATSPDHRIAAPLSYVELLEHSEQAGGGSNASAGGSASRSSGRGAGGGRRDGATGSTGSTSRPATTGKMWTPLASRLPQSLLLTSRPGSAAEVGGGDVAAVAAGGTTTTVGGGTAWEGEGDEGGSTVWCFPGWAGGGGGSSGVGNSHGGCGSESRGGGRSAAATPQDRALFGRKPSPATVARSTSYAPRRRPPCSADGRQHSRSDKRGGDDTAELYEMEKDINNSSFSLVAAIDLSTTTTPQKPEPGGRGAARAWVGSVTSALTFDDYTDRSHVNAAIAVAAAEPEPSTVIGVQPRAEDGEDEAKAAEKGDGAQDPDKDEEEVLDNNTLNGEGAGCSGGGGVAATPEDGLRAAVLEPANVNEVPRPSAGTMASTGGNDFARELGPTHGSGSPRISNEDRETAADGSTPASTAAATASTTASSVAVREGAGKGGDSSSGIGGATAGDGNRDERLSRPASARLHTEECDGAGEGGGAAKWWREALGPTSRRPVTRRSMLSGVRDVVVGGGGIGGGTRSTGCIWEWQGDGARLGSDVNRTVCGGDGGGNGGGGDRRRSKAAAPICGFSTESKHRNLEDFLKRRSSIDESEGLASTRVRGWEEALARARRGAHFRHLIGRNTIRQNLDQSLREKACETLALDLRGYGTHLVAPETPAAGDSVPQQRRPPRCATAGATATSRVRRRTMTKAWSSSTAEKGRKDRSGGPADSAKPPPFGAARGTTVQEARITVVTDQAGMWGKCSQAHFGRFEEKPYIHSFRPHTSHGLRDFHTTSRTSTVPRLTCGGPPSSGYLALNILLETQQQGLHASPHHDEGMESELNIALVGDSVLDDHFWLDQPANDVRAQTERTLVLGYPGRSVKVHNFAVDESTISCVLRGRTPGANYRNGRRLANMEPYPVGGDGVVRPLELLRAAKPTHVVLSVGGNDARLRFLSSLNPDVITELMITDGFVANLRRVIETIRADVTPNIIIVYVYMPEFKAIPLLSMLPPARILQRLLVNFSKFFIELAEEFRLPIIDLSRTFNPHDKTHYGSTPIEPSNVSGQFIADLIAQVLAQFRFGEETKGKIFSGVGKDLRVQDLGPDATRRFSYERELQAFLDRKKVEKPPSTCVIG
eukprot:g9048.t1